MSEDMNLLEWMRRKFFGGGGASGRRYTYSFPYAIHKPACTDDGQVANGEDGNGSPQNGNDRPQLDTLYGVMNSTQTTQSARLKFFNQDGTPAFWGDGQPHRDILLGPGRSVAYTFIKNNVFPDPPQNFVGYGEMETDADLPVYSMVSGGGFFPDHWNTISANIPVYRELENQSLWRFGYLIPFFNDYNHAAGHGYRTELIITNFGTVPASFWITYTIGEYYEGAGTQYKSEITVDARHSCSCDVYELLQTAGYTYNKNSEGSISMEAHAGPEGGSPLLAVKAAAMLIHWNRDKTAFSAGQGSWQ